MSDERWNDLMSDTGTELTAEEMRQGWHFCPDWDGLLIGPGMMEEEHCICYEKGKL